MCSVMFAGVTWNSGVMKTLGSAMIAALSGRDLTKMRPVLSTASMQTCAGALSLPGRLDQSSGLSACGYVLV